MLVINRTLVINYHGIQTRGGGELQSCCIRNVDGVYSVFIMNGRYFRITFWQHYENDFYFLTPNWIRLDLCLILKREIMNPVKIILLNGDRNEK